MFYTVYKVTNLVNNKIYIGKHQTLTIDDRYMGSGKVLNQAIEKYGVENFQKEILFIFDNEEEMNAKEKELVTEDFVAQDTNYNLCLGGKGGFSYINSSGIPKFKGKKHTDKTRQIIAEKASRRVLSNESREKIGLKHRGTKKPKVSEALKGKPKSAEHKAKIAASAKGKSQTREDVICPHCGFVGKPPNVYKYHFKKCAGKVFTDAR